MKKFIAAFANGIVTENPTFRLVLGTCPTLAVTTSAINGVGMGIATMFVLVFSNLFISLLRNIIPSKVRIPCFVVVIATFVTIVQMVLEAYVPSLHNSLGLYIPLIVVNCIILGRAEAYASKNPVMLSIADGIGMGVGFTLALTIMGAIREILGAGTLFGINILGSSFQPVLVMILAPGAFFVYGGLIGILNKIQEKAAVK